MKGLSEIPKEDFTDIAEIISLKDIMKQKNNFVELLIADAMVPAISDRVESI